MLEGTQLAHTEGAEQLERHLVARAEILRAVRVARERDRELRRDAQLEEPRRRVELADRLAQARGGKLYRDVRLAQRLDRRLVEAAQIPVRRARVRAPV